MNLEEPTTAVHFCERNYGGHDGCLWPVSWKEAKGKS